MEYTVRLDKKQATLMMFNSMKSRIKLFLQSALGLLFTLTSFSSKSQVSNTAQHQDFEFTDESGFYRMFQNREMFAQAYGHQDNPIADATENA